MKNYRIDVYIVDDHTMLNEGLTDAVNRSKTIYVSRSFTTLAECRTALRERRPDVLLLDISMPDGDGTAFCQWVIEEYPKVKILAVTIHDEYSMIRRMLDSGVHGYVLKSAPIEELTTAIQTVWKGLEYISPTVREIIREGSANAVILTTVEHHILRFICEGRTNPEIADRMNLSTETVNWYRKRLLAKYGVRNSVQLASLVTKERIV
ncbi:MAG: response regulator transcription factor [Prevotella sp.]|nr:response regulator transcription factor [Prevotella sp.]MBP3219589.1 response regulator transcription factor [Prevotella sp.]